MERNEVFNEVVGCDNQIEALINIIDWFKNNEEHMKKGIEIPRGVILYGSPGNGKSLVMRCLKTYLKDIPCYVYNRKSTYVIGELNNIFHQASLDKKAVILIDELDLLIDDNKSVIRCLQENLDGIEEVSKNVLVITACNYLSDIPSPLKRRGRLSSIINFSSPTPNEITKIIQDQIKKYGLNEELIDDDELINAFDGESFVTIKTMINETILTKGTFDITSDDIIETLYKYENGSIKAKEKSLFNIAIHEAGHIVLNLKYADKNKLGGVKINGGKGYIISKTTNFPGKYSDYLNRAEIYLAGRQAEKIFFKEASGGCGSDLENARSLVYTIVNRMGYFGLDYILPEDHFHYRTVSYIKLHKNEKKEERILKRLDKKVYKYLKSKKDLIYKLAEAIYEKGYMTAKEIKAFVANYYSDPKISLAKSENKTVLKQENKTLENLTSLA